MNFSHYICPERGLIVTARGAGYFWATWSVTSSRTLQALEESPKGKSKPSWRQWYPKARRRAEIYLEGLAL